MVSALEAEIDKCIPWEKYIFMSSWSIITVKHFYPCVEYIVSTLAARIRDDGFLDHHASGYKKGLSTVVCHFCVVNEACHTSIAFDMLRGQFFLYIPNCGQPMTYWLYLWSQYNRSYWNIFSWFSRKWILFKNTASHACKHMLCMGYMILSFVWLRNWDPKGEYPTRNMR